MHYIPRSTAVLELFDCLSLVFALMVKLESTYRSRGIHCSNCLSI